MKLLRELDKEMETRMKKAVFVGRLANEDELSLSFIESQVKFQDDYQEFLMFHLTCLSPIPEELSQHFYYHNNIFRGSTRSPKNLQKIKGSLIPNYDRLGPEERRKKLEEALADKLILFSLTVSNLNLFVEILKIEPAELREEYALIPGPTLLMNETRKDFEERMLTGRPIILSHYPNLFRDPEFIYCENMLYTNLKLRLSENPTTYYVQNPEEVRCMRVSQDFFEKIEARYDDSVYVIAAEQLPALQLEIEAEGEELAEAWKRDPSEDLENGKAAIGTAAGQLPPNGGAARSVRSDAFAEMAAAALAEAPAAPALHAEPEYRDAPYAVRSPSKPLPEADCTEAEFLERLEENAKLRGLYYDSLDLYNFHVSVKTNLLTIVGGMSGTGKSQLAILYGETLGLTYGKQLKLIPVSPSYHEPGDILGYLNPATNVYHEAETGLVSLLLEAEQHPERMYMVIFDEMNLSQVEHWFSPFISLLEMEEGKRTLALYNPGAYCINQYKPLVQIGGNVIFVGTVNFDETTKSFSDRLLDRANVIIPRKLKFAEVRELQTNRSDRYIVRLNVGAKTYKGSWVKGVNGELSSLTDEEIRLFDQLHEALQRANSRMGISFRVVRAIAHYLDNIPLAANGKEAISRSTALDMQINQRILSKLSGMESAIGTLVGHCDGDVYQDGELAGILLSPEAQQLSTFKYSMETLKKKAKELMVHGFAN
jgi:hypothetical protein